MNHTDRAPYDPNQGRVATKEPHYCRACGSLVQSWEGDARALTEREFCPDCRDRYPTALRRALVEKGTYRFILHGQWFETLPRELAWIEGGWLCFKTLNADISIRTLAIEAIEHY